MVFRSVFYLGKCRRALIVIVMSSYLEATTDLVIIKRDLQVDGNLSVKGTHTVIDTNTSTSEQLIVTNDGTGPALIVTQKGTQPIVEFIDDTTTVMTIVNGGNVGIGTTQPLEKLHVQGDIQASGSTSAGTQFLGLAADAVATPSYSWTGDLNTGIYHPGADKLGLVTAGVERVSVLDNGNVGIGTTNPLAKLHVNGTFYAHGSIIQVIQGYSTSQPSSTSLTFVSGGISATITPKFATSRIFVFLQTSFQSSTNNTVRGGHKLFRDAVELDYHNDIANINIGTPIILVYRDAFSYMDSPATTSAVTYSNQFRREVGNGSYGEYVICNADSGYVTLMEIAS